MSAYRELALEMVRAVVRRPGEVRVIETDGDACILLEVCPAPEDVGRVIGARGKVADAMRAILDIVASNGRVDHRRVTLEIINPTTGVRRC